MGAAAIGAAALSGGNSGGFGKAAGSALGPLVGASGGVQGTGSAAPTQAQIASGVNPSQLQGANAAGQNGVASQQALLQALQAQQGLGAQNTGLSSQQALLHQLGQYNGASNLNSALQAQQGLYGQQSALAGQYANIANGTGPNPAQAMLNQQTGENVANQAAMMAGQRGASSNVGLLARQSAQQGAATQQQAVGQGATMQAQQSLNALQAQAAQQQAMGQTQQNIAGLAGQQVGLTQAQQQGYNNQANTLAGQQISGTTGYSQGAQNEQQILQNANAAQNSANVSSQGSVNAGNTGIAQTTLQGRQGLVGGLMNGAGAVAGLAQGGEVTPPQQMATGGEPTAAPDGPQSSFGQFLQGWGGSSGSQPATTAAVPVQSPASPPPSSASSGMGGAGASALLKAAMGAEGGLAETGGKVKAKAPSEKAEKKGNSYSNDKIPTLLSEHEIVLPRDVTLSKDPVKSAADFVSKVIAKRRVA